MEPRSGRGPASTPPPPPAPPLSCSVTVIRELMSGRSRLTPGAAILDFYTCSVEANVDFVGGGVLMTEILCSVQFYAAKYDTKSEER